MNFLGNNPPVVAKREFTLDGEKLQFNEAMACFVEEPNYEQIKDPSEFIFESVGKAITRLWAAVVVK